MTLRYQQSNIIRGSLGGQKTCTKLRSQLGRFRTPMQPRRRWGRGTLWTHATLLGDIGIRLRPLRLFQVQIWESPDCRPQVALFISVRLILLRWYEIFVNMSWESPKSFAPWRRQSVVLLTAQHWRDEPLNDDLQQNGIFGTRKLVCVSISIIFRGSKHNIQVKQYFGLSRQESPRRAKQRKLSLLQVYGSGSRAVSWLRLKSVWAMSLLRDRTCNATIHMDGHPIKS